MSSDLSNDTIDHMVTGGLAVISIVGAIIVQMQTGDVPEWLTVIAGAATGFYFRGRVNGQYNSSLMGKLEEQRLRQRLLDEIKEKGGSL